MADDAVTTTTVKMPASVGDFRKHGSLWKKRGGFGRWHMGGVGKPWEVRAFGLTHWGLLVYYEGETIPSTGLSQPRQTLDLTKKSDDKHEQPHWFLPTDTGDGPSKFMVIIEHPPHQRWKLCANNEAELKAWTTALGNFCPHSPESKPTRSDSPVTSRGRKSVSPATRRGVSPATRRSRFSAPAVNGNTTTEIPRKNQGAPRQGARRRPLSSRIAKRITPGFLGPGTSEELACAVLSINAALFLSSLVTCPRLHLLLVVFVNLVFTSALLRTTDAAFQAGVASVPVPAAGANNGPAAEEDEEPRELLVAGSSIPRVEAAATKEGVTSFTSVDPAQFGLRLKGYSTSREKGPSGPSLYELIALDVFKTSTKVDRIYEHVKLPLDGLIETGHSEVPSLFIVNCQFPREPQPMSPNDTLAGCSVVFYFAIKQETVDALNSPEPSEAVKLFAEWARLAPDDPTFRGRFKAIGFIEDIQKFGIPMVARSYNGKPVLIKKTGTVHRGPDNKFIEMDINIHKFTYMCRSALIGMKDSFSRMQIRAGFTIEGREDSELPETLLGGALINSVSLDNAVDL